MKDNKAASVNADQLGQKSLRKVYCYLPFTVENHEIIGLIASEFLLELSTPLILYTEKLGTYSQSHQALCAF